MRALSGLGAISVSMAMLLLAHAQSFSQTAPSLYRINCSGPAFTDARGIQWTEDTHFTSGSPYTGDEVFTASEHPQLYQDVRWNDPTLLEPMKYVFPVAEGSYTVRLHFAEIWSGAYSVGGRVFDVSINGTRMLQNLDIFKEVGQMAPLVMNFEVASAEGKITIEFANVVQNAAIAGIEILPPGAASINPIGGDRSRHPQPALMRVHASPSGRLSLPLPAGTGAVHLLDPRGRRVASQATLAAGRAVFEGLRPGVYFAAPAR